MGTAKSNVTSPVDFLSETGTNSDWGIVLEAFSDVSAFLVAENRLLRETLVRLLQKRAGVIIAGESRSFEAALGQIIASQCDVLLLDSPATIQAAALIQGLCEEAPEIKTVLFGMDENTDSFLKAVQWGVRGYLLKDASSEEIIAAVRGVADGEAVCPPKLCLALFHCVKQECQHKPEVADQYAFAKFGLTYRQRQLITLVAGGLTTKEIAANLNLSQYTVKNHMYRIMKQLAVRSRYEVVDMVRASGNNPNA
jgi:DNA-binding NarL/FixJ family response regulator